MTNSRILKVGDLIYISEEVVVLIQKDNIINGNPDLYLDRHFFKWGGDNITNFNFANKNFVLVEGKNK